MKKGYYALLALPLAATMCMAGCGKTSRNAQELLTLHTDTLDMHSEYFTDVQDRGTYLYVTYGDDVDVKVCTVATKDSPDLLKRYNFLNTVYSRTLTLAYTYYADFNGIFYENIKDKKPDAKELTKLYDKLKTFQRELTSFNTAKADFQREIDLFGVDSQIVGSSIDKFDYYYNSLIGTTLDFVNYFKDLHVKYFYGEDKTIDASYAQRVYDEGLLAMANYLYKDYLVSMAKNGTVKLTDMWNTNEKGELVVKDEMFISEELDCIVKKSVYNESKNKIEPSAASVSIDTKILTSLDNGSEEEMKNAKDRIREYDTQLNTFYQYFKLYNKVYKKVDMDKYNNYRFSINGGYESEEAYLNSLSVVDAANVRVMLNFDNVTVKNFLKQLSKINASV